MLSQDHLNLFLLLQVLDLLVPMKLIVSLVDTGIFYDFFYDCISLLFLFLRDTSGIIARIKESRWLAELGSLSLNYFCLDSLTSTLSSKYPTRGFYPFTLKIPDFVKQISTFAMREPPLPFPRVSAAVVPKHLSLALPHVLTEIPLVAVAIRPEILAWPIFAVIAEMPLVLVPVLAYPSPLALSYSVHELPFVRGPTGPEVLSFSMRLPMDVVALVHVPICEILYPIPMFHETGKLS